MLIYPEIDPVALIIGPIKIHWYGITYIAGFAVAWLLAVRQSARSDTVLMRGQVDDLIFFAALGAVLGGRLGYSLFYGWDRLADNPLWLFQVWQGGMSFHGGLIGVLLAMYWFARSRVIDYRRLLDFIVPLAPIGLGFGRIGNFIGQELWGRASTAPWAMVFPRDPLLLPRHPSQLYQFALEGLLLFIIVFWFSRKPRPRFSISGVFLFFYGSFRFFVEFFRQPDRHIGFDALGWLTRGQLLSMPMIAIGLLILIYSYHASNDSSDHI